MPDRYLCTEEPFENFLKMIRAECVWIITFNSNDNRKFLMNKNICLNVLKVAEINKHQLNSFTNTMKTLNFFSISVFKDNELDCLLHQFVFTHNEVHFIKLSKKMNHYIIMTLNLYWFVQVAAMYKQKINKIWSVSSFKSDEKASESDFNWWQQIINAEKTADFH